MTVCAKSLIIYWIIVRIVSINVINIKLTWIFGYKFTTFTMILLMN